MRTRRTSRKCYTETPDELYDDNFEEFSEESASPPPKKRRRVQDSDSDTDSDDDVPLPKKQRGPPKSSLNSLVSPEKAQEEVICISSNSCPVPSVPRVDEKPAAPAISFVTPAAARKATKISDTDFAPSDEEAANADSCSDFEPPSPSPVTKRATRARARSQKTGSAKKARPRSRAKKSAASAENKPTNAFSEERITFLAFLLENNKPYTVTSLAKAAKGVLKRASVSRLCEALSVEGTLRMQEVGKSRVYFLNQKKLSSIKEVVDAAQRGDTDMPLAQQVAQLTAEQFDERRRILRLKEELSALNSLLPLEKMREFLQRVKQLQQQQQQQLRQVELKKSNEINLSDQQKKKLLELRIRLYDHWRRSRQTAREWCANYLEYYVESRQKVNDFMDDHSIERDDLHRVDLKQFHALTQQCRKRFAKIMAGQRAAAANRKAEKDKKRKLLTG
ncbi:MAG: hypothetical protein MHM6MM_007945 [Cercozoa sp. M6MM]